MTPAWTECVTCHRVMFPGDVNEQGHCPDCATTPETVNASAPPTAPAVNPVDANLRTIRRPR